MSDSSADRHRPDLRPLPSPPSRRARIVQGIAIGLALSLVCAAVVTIASVALNALVHAGRVVQRDVGTAVDNGIHRLLTPYCDQPADR